MNALFSDYKIRSARIADLAILAEVKRAAARLFWDAPYAFLVDDETLSLDFVTYPVFEWCRFCNLINTREPNQAFWYLSIFTA